MMQNNVKVAITGGIGSGKSTVLKIIEEYGHNVISCDEIYKDLLTDKNFACRLTEEFGNGIMRDNDTIDRQKLSAIVFCDKNKLKKLNEIAHHRILEEAFKRMEGNGVFYCEIPLLFEGGYEKLFDKVLVVLRNKKERISSVIKRDKTDAISVENRIKNQLDYDKSGFEKYYVINNSGNIADLGYKVKELLEKISK